VHVDIKLTHIVRVIVNSPLCETQHGRLHLKCNGTHAEARFCLSAKQMSTFKSAGASVQSTAGSRGMSISGSNGSNAGYTMFRDSVKRLHTPFASFPFILPPMLHRVHSHFNWTLDTCFSLHRRHQADPFARILCSSFTMRQWLSIEIK